MAKTKNRRKSNLLKNNKAKNESKFQSINRYAEETVDRIIGIRVIVGIIGLALGLLVLAIASYYNTHNNGTDYDDINIYNE